MIDILNTLGAIGYVCLVVTVILLVHDRRRIDRRLDDLTFDVAEVASDVRDIRNGG